MSDPNEWVTLTRRTEDPKLAWIEMHLDLLAIEHKRDGESTHAPILKVRSSDHAAAFERVVDPIDELEDIHPVFQFATGEESPHEF